MKAFKIISTYLITGVIFLSLPQAIAQDTITKELLTRESGVWFGESTNEEGDKINHYSWHGYVEELELARSVHFDVDADTKKLISSLHVYTTVSASGKQTESLIFNSDGNVGSSVGVIDGNKTIIRFQGVNTNKIMFSGTIKKELSENGTKSHETWNDVIFNGNYLASTPRSENRKLVDTNLMSLFQNGDILTDEDRKTAGFLESFEKLIGKWEMKNETGDFGREIQWRLSGMGSLLVEKFNYINEKNEISGGGINITGIDPSNGLLTMWSVDKDGFSRSGGWDLISDKMTGQRQNDSRIIRTFEGDDTMTVYWQSKKNGEYSGEDGKYTLKRVENTQ